jgi:signal transduction histidine kinase/CheY-like chemotaxis protein
VSAEPADRAGKPAPPDADGAGAFARRLSWLDRFLPAELRSASPEDRARARLVMLALLPFFFAAIPAAIDYHLGGSSAAVGVIAGVVLLAAFSPLLLRFGVAVAVHFQLALFVGIMAVLAYLSGGLGSPPLYAFVLIPTLGVALVGRTPAAAWSLIASLVIVGFLALELSGRSPATEVTQAALLRGHAILGVLGIAVALAFTLVLETQRRRFVADLERARVEAEAASRAKSAFLANVSHELRTPMNGVIGMSALLQNADIDPDHGEMLDVIQKSAGSLLALLDDILDYAQIEAGHLRINAEPFDVRKLLRETVELLNPVAQCKGLELRYDIEPHVPGRLVGDASRIGQILLNLLDNAIKFTPSGFVQLRADARLEAASAILVLRVEDTGPGMPEGDIDRIFERFERLEASSGQVTPGSGLGLAICRGLLELIGGEIQVESRPGEGACFEVRLPLELAPAALTDEEPVTREDPRASTSHLESLRILVVEDDVVNQLVIRGMLESLGCRVAVAEDGQECLERLAGEPFDAILMDCQMPRMDGLTATQAIRSSPRTESLPVIGLTASLTAQDRESCLHAGMDEVLGKPCTIESLREALARQRALGAVSPHG